jgi:hypothetical protein
LLLAELATPYRTASGNVLTDADLDEIADEVEHADYDVDDLLQRRTRPRSGPSSLTDDG